MEKKTMNEKIVIDGITYLLVKDDGQKSEFRSIKSLSEREFQIDVQGKVIRDWQLNKFTRADGSEGKVHSLLIGDGSGTIKVALWGPHADTAKDVAEGDILTVKNGYTKKGQKDFIELHAGTKTTIKLEGSRQEAL